MQRLKKIIIGAQIRGWYLRIELILPEPQRHVIDL